jgi:hypothetical protein
MSRATSIAGVRPLGWLARARARPERRSWRGRAQSSCLADGAGAAGLGPFTALGNGARDDHARQRSGARPRLCSHGYLCTRQELATAEGGQSAANLFLVRPC